jgi:hypothetical protein
MPSKMAISKLPNEKRLEKKDWNVAFKKKDMDIYQPTLWFI